MRRILVAMSILFAFGATCTGAVTDGEKDLVKEDPVVVPVDADKDDENKDADEEYFCCEFKDDADVTQYALVEGPADCQAQYGAKQGKFTSGNQCIPCCCETPNDAADLEKGYAHELTTPKSCSTAGGECKEAGDEACEDKGGEDEDKDHERKPAPGPRPPRDRLLQRPEGR